MDNENQPNNELKTLVRLAAVVNSSLEITEVLDRSMRFVEELAQAEASSIFERDFESNELFFRLARGDSGAKASEARVKMGQGVAGWVAASGQPLLCNDVSDCEHFSGQVDRLTGFHTRSILALPIRYKGNVTGVLEVLNKKRGQPFTEKDLETLTIAAAQIGIAMENARLYTRLGEKFELKAQELEAVQARLIRSERLAALGQLAEGVAHEVRNPVMAIGGFAARLRKRLPPESKELGYAEVILKEAQRLMDTVTEVERFATLPDPRPAPIPLSQLVAKAQRIWLDRAPDAQPPVELTGDEALVRVDLDLTALALAELFENAAEAGASRVWVTPDWEAAWFTLTIDDDGRGLAEPSLGRAFDPFFTSKTRGAGLGLTTVNRIVSGHGGQVRLSRSARGGVRVTLQFPVS